jgi:hypothetical protein
MVGEFFSHAHIQVTTHRTSADMTGATSANKEKMSPSILQVQE